MELDKEESGRCPNSYDDPLVLRFLPVQQWCWSENPARSAEDHLLKTYPV